MAFYQLKNKNQLFFICDDISRLLHVMIRNPVNRNYPIFTFRTANFQNRCFDFYAFARMI